MDSLQVEDLFAAGLGFDLVGAYLLGRGLLASPRQQMLVSGSSYGGNAYMGVGRAIDRIDGVSGLSFLCLGFGLQAIGYVAIIHGNNTVETGTGEALVALLLTVAAVAVGLTAGWYRRLRRLRPTLVEMAHHLGDGSRLAYPLAATLVKWGEVLGDKPETGESDRHLLQRTFGIQDAAEKHVDDQLFHRLSDGAVIHHDAEDD